MGSAAHVVPGHAPKPTDVPRPAPIFIKSRLENLMSSSLEPLWGFRLSWAASTGTGFRPSVDRATAPGRDEQARAEGMAAGPAGDREAFCRPVQTCALLS